MRKSLLLASLLTLSLFADGTLQEEARKAGLGNIPGDKKALIRLVDDPGDPVTDAKRNLGKMLFFDPRVLGSADRTCNSCHNLGLAGSAPGNAPTAMNAAMSRYYGNKGHRSITAFLKEHIATLGMERPSAALKQIPGYFQHFKNAFSKERDPFRDENVARALTAFLRTLTTPSRYDAFMVGHSDSMNERQKKGLKTFLEKGCVRCHNGAGLGGDYQPFPATSSPYPHDPKFRQTLRVPTLRNVTETGPWFHDGRVRTLEEAVAVMAKTQLGSELSRAEVEDIVSFLRALEGSKPKLLYPILPPSVRILSGGK